MNARSSRSLPEGEFPANGLPHERLAFAAKYAALAPTESNWQPWKFRVTDTHVELRAKNDPALETMDPDGRELMIACGSALQYLTVALKYFGCLGQVSLFPDLGESALVATVHLGFGRGPEARQLFEAMTASRVRLSTLGGTPVSETMLAVLAQSAVGERGWLDFAQSEISRQHVMEIAMSEEQSSTNLERSHAHPANMVGGLLVSRWLRPFFAFGARNLDPEDSWNEDDEPAGQKPASMATLAVVKTKTDDKHGWLAAGQTMARTVLQAQALGLAWAFFDPVRRREAREALRVGVGHKGFAQVILCFGALADGEMIPQMMRTAVGARLQ